MQGDNENGGIDWEEGLKKRPKGQKGGVRTRREDLYREKERKVG